MSEELLKELRAVKETLQLLQRRVVELERQVTAPSPRRVVEPPAPASPSPVVPPKPPSPPVAVPKIIPTTPPQRAEPTGPRCADHPNRVIQWTCATCSRTLCESCVGIAFHGQVYCRTCITKTEQSHATPPGRQKETKEALETRIGRDWLNRIGITSLVLGVAFFILYTFQYFGAAMKIATGFAVAGGLLGLGVWLERRPSLRWYALGLIGGGWALLYFTTYAMHHLEAVRILASAWLDLLFLFMVAVGAVGHSLKYRSETITALALLLGFLTICISDVTYFTLAASVLLVGALAWIVVRQRWHGLYLYGVVASYATYVFWIAPQIQLSRVVAIQMPSVAHATFWLKAGFVACYWVAYNLVLFAFDERDARRRNALLTATLVNTTFFVHTILLGMVPLYQDVRHLVLAGVGAFYVVSELVAKHRRLPTIASTHLLVGLTLMTLAIPLKLSGRWISFLWLVEVAGLAWLGLRHARWPYRLFAMGLAVVMVGRMLLFDLWNSTPLAMAAWMVPWRVVIGSVSIVSFGAVAAWYRWSRFESVLRPIEASAFHGYFIAASSLLWVLLMLEVDTSWLALAWALEATAIIALGFRLNDKVLRVLGAIGSGCIGLHLLGVMGQWDAWRVSAVAGLWYGVSAVYRSSFAQQLKVWPSARHVYAIAASCLVTLLVGDTIDRPWLSVAWAAEAFALVGVGVTLKDRAFRLTGLGVWVILLGLLAVDLLRSSFRVGSFSSWTLTTTPWVIAIGYALRWVSRRVSGQDASDAEYWLAEVYATTASVMMTILLWREAQARWLSVWWAVEGLALVGVGFGVRDKAFRVSGLVVFALLVLKVLFVDLAGAETIYRILSFIVTGVILLVTSYAYVRFQAMSARSKEEDV